MMHPFALGIDLHKKSSTWKLVDATRSVIWSRTVPCTPVSIESALKCLPVSQSKLPVAIESTCGWRWVSALLESNGCDIHIAHPYKLRLIADSSQKTDEEDAKTLAEFLQLGYLPESWRAPDEVESWRRIVRTRVSLVQDRTRTKNRITGMLASFNPDCIPKTLEIDELLALVKEQTEHIRNLDEEIAKISTHPISKLLMTIPAVGKITAVSILAEVGDFSRFANSAKLSCFAGLNPSQRSSGETVRFGSIAKGGSKILRTMLIEAAMRFKPGYDTSLNNFFERTKKKHGAMSARVALARKLLTIMWSMVKYNKVFTPSEDIVKLGDLV